MLQCGNKSQIYVFISGFTVEEGATALAAKMPGSRYFS